MSNHSRKVSVCARSSAIKSPLSLPARIGVLLLGLLLSSLTLIAAASAATITVGNAGDPATGNAAKCNVASTCTLRDAIAKAAAVTGTAAGDTIVFSLPANSTITLSGSALVVDRNLTIDGSAVSGLAINGNQQSSVFETGNWWDADAAVTAVLKGLIIKDGKNASYGGGGISNIYGATLTLINSTVSGNTTDSGKGGGISNAGTLTLTGSTVSGNSTVRTFGKGGGIYNVGALTLVDSTVSGNMVGGYGDGGGGIYSEGVSLTLIRSTVSGNMANGDGGGISNYRGISTLTGSTVYGNTATYGGGGIRNFSTLTLTNSTISNNTATNDGGGGIFNGYGYPIALTLINSTVSGNTATYGGGIENNASLTLIQSTLATNTISGGAQSDIWHSNFGNATASAVNTIVQSCAVIVDTTWPLTDNGGNLDGGSGCGFTNASSKFNATLDLGVLAGNGGPTLTMMPGTNSDAVGFGLSDVCTNAPVNSRDQRGYPRPAVGCASGAVDPNRPANDSIFFDGFDFGGR